MDSFPQITNFSHYSQNRPHINRSSPINNRFILNQTPEISPPSRTSSTPKNPTNQLLYKELDRLEELLDFKLLKLRKKGEESSEKVQKKQVKIYSNSIDGVISCLKYLDSKFSKFLNRLWIGYQKVAIKPFENKIKVNACSTLTDVKVKDMSVQVCFEIEESFDGGEEYDTYIKLLNRAIHTIGGLNNTKIIKKLNQLLVGLKPIEMPERDLKEYINFNKSTKLSNLMNPIPVSLNEDEKVLISRNRLGHIQISRGEQANIGPAADTLLTILAEKDKELYQASETLKNLKSVEIKLEQTQLDLAATQRALSDLQNRGCKACLERMEKQKGDKIQIAEMKKNLKSSEKTKEELIETKSKLKESIIVIGKNSEKINKLSEDLEDLQKQLEKTRAERLRLETRLAEEEKLRASLEVKLKQEMQKTYSVSVQSGIKLLDPVVDESLENLDFVNKTVKNQSLTRKIFEDLDFRFSESPELKNSSKTPLGERKKAKGLLSEAKQKSGKIRLNKKKDFLSILNISKDEFLALSKKARIELFECLYEHKEKCGGDCEHLRRAMVIRRREKGTVFPVKKYNIVKS